MIFTTKWKTCGKLFLLSFILLSFLPSSLTAQTAEIPSHVESYRLESGSYDGETINGEEAVNVFTCKVTLT
jgi:hypothetical protein